MKNLFTDNRAAGILRMLGTKSGITVAVMAEALGVSERTIRNDIRNNVKAFIRHFQEYLSAVHIDVGEDNSNNHQKKNHRENGKLSPAFRPEYRSNRSKQFQHQLTEHLHNEFVLP